jgi:hypothetical protein
MTIELFWFLLVVYGVVCGAFSAFVAGEKNYNEASWFFGGFFFGVIGLVAAAGLPMNPTPSANKSATKQVTPKAQ